MLRRYAARRDQLCPASLAGRFFISTAGTPLLIGSVDGVFARPLALAGIRTPAGGRRPRVHDLSHYADGWVMRPAVTLRLAAAAEPVLPSA
jgi:integrase/recombinase XerD